MTILKNMLMNRTIFCLGLLLAMSISAAQVYAAAVGRVVFAMGQPQASDTAGISRILKKGDDIFSGDTLFTYKGRLQISFIDGAFISLQPNTEYEIDQYKYSGKPDGTEQAIYRLIKGGVRAVTGLIGRDNPDAYKVHTAVATIGIRGTGHNTRLCQGDCPGKADGLYHNTWEGITYVVNDVDSVDVPAGRGVYVRDIESLIQFLDQPSIVTALEVAAEQLAEVEEEQEIFVAGEQRTSTGAQTVVAVGSTVLPKGVNPNGGLFDDGLAFVVISPDLDDPSDLEDAFLGHNASVFFNASGEPIGVILTDLDFDETGTDVRVFGTIDLNAMLGGDDPAAVAEVSALVAAADPAIIDEFLLNPATVAEFTVTGGLSTGRWAGGKFLVIEDSSVSSFPAEIDDLTGFQSIHFVFGQEPPPLPTLSTATYNLINATDSTSVSGATIGNGATSGVIIINFGLSSGTINMVVNHAGLDYLISGSLNILASENNIFDQFLNVTASTTNANSACYSGIGGCLTEIDGGFFGPGIDSNNTPQYIGLGYDIDETDIIIGIAGLETTASLIQIFASTVIPLGVNPNGGFFDDGYTLIAVSPDLTNTSDPVETVLGINTSIFFNASGEPIGAILTEPEINNIRSFGTIDLNAVLGGDDPAVVAEVSALVAAADPAIIDELLLNPATVAEFTVTGGLSTGRWAGGKFLSLEPNASAEIDDLTGFQSIHFVFGAEPPPLPTLGTASYNLINGTDSTSVSGATIGNGATSGVIIVNFGLSSGAINMVVNHAGLDYLISGSLNIFASENDIDDQFLNVIATTSNSNSDCYSGIGGCLTEIDGAFFGPGIDTNNTPQYLGLEYDISETDEITGVAGFETGALVILTPQQQLLASTLTGVGIFFQAFKTRYADVHLSGDPVTSFDALTDNGFEVFDNTLSLGTGSQNFDTFNDGTLFITRWSGGSFTEVNGTGSSSPGTFTFSASGDQSIHLAFGVPYTGVLPTSNNTGFYTFISGSQTQSTTDSGSSIGNGIVSGAIVLDFVSATVTPSFIVDHGGNNITVSGAGFSITQHTGSSTTQTGFSGSGTFSGGICTGGCTADISGTFAGNTSTTIGTVPAAIGVIYHIHESDPIGGAGGFGFSSIGGP